MVLYNDPAICDGGGAKRAGSTLSGAVAARRGGLARTARPLHQGIGGSRRRKLRVFHGNLRLLELNPIADSSATEVKRLSGESALKGFPIGLWPGILFPQTIS